MIFLCLTPRKKAACIVYDNEVTDVDADDDDDVPIIEKKKIVFYLGQQPRMKGLEKFIVAHVGTHLSCSRWWGYS